MTVKTIYIDDDDYNRLNFTFNDDNTIDIECRTGMTSISFSLCNQNNINKLDEYYEWCDNYKHLIETNKVDVWNKIGYCGSQFIEWLFAVKSNLKNGKYNDDQNYKIILMAFVHGIDLIKESLNAS
jgi:hypothetical protein